MAQAGVVSSRLLTTIGVRPFMVWEPGTVRQAPGTTVSLFQEAGMKYRLASLLLTIVMIGALSGCAYLDRASETNGGTQADAFSDEASLSGDGRWVAFRSMASNLVAGDTNDNFDIFVRDNLTEQVVRVSVATDGTQGDDRSDDPSISDDGRRIAFASMATTFSAGDTNFVQDVFVHDRDADGDGIFDEPGATSTTRMNPATTDPPGLGGNSRPEIFGDGTGVVYESGNRLLAEDVNVWGDIYTTRLVGGVPVTSLISKPIGSTSGANDSNLEPSVNRDGTVVAFSTLATNLYPGDTLGYYDVAVWDANGSGPGLPSLTRVSGAVEPIGNTQGPSVSRDTAGRFVAFQSAAANLVPGDVGANSNIFVLDRTTGAITAESRTPLGASSNDSSLLPTISADGTRVSYWTFASDLAPGDTNGLLDVAVRDRASNLTQIASTTLALQPGNGVSRRPSLSANGKYVAFETEATNFTETDANGPVTDVFTRAAIVPRVDSVVRAGSTASPAPLDPGSNTLHITGKGFGPDVVVGVGNGVTVTVLSHTASQITAEVVVASSAETGPRDVFVSNLGLPISGLSSIGLCSKCVTVQP